MSVISNTAFADRIKDFADRRTASQSTRWLWIGSGFRWNWRSNYTNPLYLTKCFANDRSLRCDSAFDWNSSTAS